MSCEMACTSGKWKWKNLQFSFFSNIIILLAWQLPLHWTSLYSFIYFFISSFFVFFYLLRNLLLLLFCLFVFLLLLSNSKHLSTFFHPPSLLQTKINSLKRLSLVNASRLVSYNSGTLYLHTRLKCIDFWASLAEKSSRLIEKSFFFVSWY